MSMLTSASVVPAYHSKIGSALAASSRVSKKQALSGAPSQSRFGSHLPHAPGGPAKVGRMTRLLDFTDVGASPLTQLALLLVSLVASRLWAANERRKASEHKRWNEIRENLTRDMPVFFFWFFGVPLLQRAYLYYVCRKNPNLKNILIQKAPVVIPPNAGLGQQIKHAFRSMNPMSTLHIASSQQVKDQMTQTLKTFEKAGMHPDESAYKETKANYEHLIKQRNLATALGLASVSLLMGVGINVLNIYFTRKNVIAEANDADAPHATSKWPSNVPVSPFLFNPAAIPMMPMAPEAMAMPPFSAPFAVKPFVSRSSSPSFSNNY